MVTSIRTGLLALLSILTFSLYITSAQEHIRNLRHDILPRTPNYGDPYSHQRIKKRGTFPTDIILRDDTIRIAFTAFNATFHLYLEPNIDLIHPDADLGPDVNLEDIKAFKGVVVQDEEHAERKWKRAATTTPSRTNKRTLEHMLYEEGVVGWARMMVEHDTNSPEDLVLRGAFMANGDTYHVTSRQHYHIQKRSDDAMPSPSSPADTGSSLVIFRDSDLFKPPSLRKRGLDTTRPAAATEQITCGADHMLNKTQGYVEAASSHDYYYPPDLTATVPMTGGYDISSSWVDVLKSPMMKRDVAVKVAGPNPVPEGCPANRLVNYMGVAADCAYVRAYKGQAEARKQIFADFNTASGIYESTFNVALGVIALNISTENCPATPVTGVEWNQDCSASYSIDQRLSDFSRWRGQDSRSDDGAGLWHLMTRCNTGSVVGIAWTKALCQMKSQSQNPQGQGVQYTAGTGVSSITPNEWMVVAHEIGHGFGAIHDCTAQTCPSSGGQCCPLSATTCDAGAQYIMNPSEQTATRVFSPCSIKAICGTIQSSSGQCLQPPGTRQTQSSQENICGNGLKEPGEDCDCGSAEDCGKDPCCDGTTCKFKAGAVCDDLNDDCCLNCQLRPAGQICRQAISECDIQEVCTGTNATCPPDVRVPNLTPCTGANNATNLQCANGVCTSRDLQCQQQDRQGITKQCGASNSCDLMCNDPGGNPLSCMQIPGTYFQDGTPCGFGGTCSAGHCLYSSGIGGVLNWARNHLTIVIPVGCLIGLILICCIWSCCCSGPLQRRRQKKLMMKKRPSAGAVLRPNGSRTRGSAGVPPSTAAAGGLYPREPNGSNLYGAQHAAQGQQYPMGPLPPQPPAPVYYDPAVLQHRSREEDDLQRALEESRKEHEQQQRESMTMSAAVASAAFGTGTNGGVSTERTGLQSRNGASVMETPRMDNSATSPTTQQTYNDNSQHGSQRGSQRGGEGMNSSSNSNPFEGQHSYPPPPPATSQGGYI
ncbi:hypothetical protein EDD11_005053 [Mortierella claussenii]|nr:hypothetical protein EDD11_005053 [Mortierella claussenii]